MSATTIKPCKCQHADQDARYGQGNRVHNACKDGERCTVCQVTKGAK